MNEFQWDFQSKLKKLSFKLLTEGLLVDWHICQMSSLTSKVNQSMSPYRYHELRPLTSYFSCHSVVLVDFPNIYTIKIVRIFYRINSRCRQDIYTLTRSFSNQQWYNKSTYDHLVERLLSPLSFYRWYVKFKIRYSDVSKFRMTFKWVYLISSYAILVDIFDVFNICTIFNIFESHSE